MEIRYPARVEAQDDGSFLVTFVDLVDTVTEGKTRAEALFNASEVLSAMLAWRLDHAKDMPPPSLKVKGAHYIAPDAKTQAAMLLRLARGERDWSELARATAITACQNRGRSRHADCRQGAQSLDCSPTSRSKAMNSNQVKGTIKDAAGKARRVTAEAVGNTKQEVKGAVQQAEGKAQKALGDAQ